MALTPASPVTVSTTSQARWKDCCAPSSQIDLTLISNAEEPVGVYTTQRTIVPAGINSPTVAAVIADGGTGGSLPAGNVAYLYCYASSQYPQVEADTTAGGFEWPKSQPSPVSLNFTNTVNHKINVTVATTNLPGVDKILIYRTAITPGASAPTYTSIVEQAGQVFFVGFVDNTPSVATITYTDNVVATQEEMEVDNYPAPEFWKCLRIDPYWYGVGNPDLIVPVTIDISGNCTATYNAFYSGRENLSGLPQLVTFDNITAGGFDGQGTFYYLYSTVTVAQVSVNSDLSTQDFPGFTGTTTMRVRGNAGVLFRSKANNPFAWGYTQYQTAGDSQIRIAQQFAQTLGGYGVAIASMPQQQLMKIDFERPSRCYLVDTSIDLTTNFEEATRRLDSRYIVTCHDTQFLATLPSEETTLMGVDTSNYAILQSDAGSQAPVSSPVKNTLRQMQTQDTSSQFFHGIFDSFTECSVFWIKTATDPNSLVINDGCVIFHAPSGQWFYMRDLGISASCVVYDPVQDLNLSLVGTDLGYVAQAFFPGKFDNFLDESALAQGGSNNPYTQRVATAATYTQYTVVLNSAGSGLASTYFDVYQNPTSFDRFWFALQSFGGTAPAQPSGCTLREIAVNFPLWMSVNATVGFIATAFQNAGYTSVSRTTNTMLATAPADGILPAASSGTAPVTITNTSPTLPTGTLALDVGYSTTPSPIGMAGAWVMTYSSDGQNQQWARVTGISGTAYSTNAWFNPKTNTISPYSASMPPLGQGVFFGKINCEAKTYFSPSDMASGQGVEVWATQENVDTGNQWWRMYSEYDAGIYGNPFPLVQTKRGDNTTPSDQWITSTTVPSTLVPQFGVRMIERGYQNYTVLAFSFGRKP